MKSRRTAFTLVELLVVIGIIALLIGILLPVLGKARAAGNSAACESNLHQMGIAMVMYTNEYGFYPGAYAIDRRTGIDVAVWPTRLRKYVSSRDNTNVKLFHCPAREDTSQWQFLTGSVSTLYATPSTSARASWEGFGYNCQVGGPSSTVGEALLLAINNSVQNLACRQFSYGYNGTGIAQHTYDTVAKSTRGDSTTSIGLGLGYCSVSDSNYGGILTGYGEIRANQIKRPTEMIAIGDRISNDDPIVQFANESESNYLFSISPSEAGTYPGSIHNKGSNILFCDGHVSFMRQDQLCWIAGGGQTRQITPGYQNGHEYEIRKLWNNDNDAKLDATYVH